MFLQFYTWIKKGVGVLKYLLLIFPCLLVADVINGLSFKTEHLYVTLLFTIQTFWQGYSGIRHWMINLCTCSIMYIMTLKSLSTANLNQRIKYYPRFASLKSYQTFIKSIIYSPLFSHSLYFWYRHPLSTKSGP